MRGSARPHLNYKLIIGCQCWQENPKFYGQWTVEDTQYGLFAKSLQILSCLIPALFENTVEPATLIVHLLCNCKHSLLSIILLAHSTAAEDICDWGGVGERFVCVRRPKHAHAREVWGYASSGKFCKWDALRLLLTFWGHFWLNVICTSSHVWL